MKEIKKKAVDDNASTSHMAASLQIALNMVGGNVSSCRPTLPVWLKTIVSILKWKFIYFPIDSIVLLQKGILKTGGGSYKPSLTDADSQILAIMGPQLHPLPNPFDDAAVYFGKFFFIFLVVLLYSASGGKKGLHIKLPTAYLPTWPVVSIKPCS